MSFLGFECINSILCEVHGHVVVHCREQPSHGSSYKARERGQVSITVGMEYTNPISFPIRIPNP